MMYVIVIGALLLLGSGFLIYKLVREVQILQERNINLWRAIDVKNQELTEQRRVVWQRSSILDG